MFLKKIKNKKTASTAVNTQQLLLNADTEATPPCTAGRVTAEGDSRAGITPGAEPHLLSAARLTAAT